METYKSVYEYADDLKLDYPKMSDFERLSIAAQMQRNSIIRAGLQVSPSDSYPSALEAVAIQLGMRPENERSHSGTILYELTAIRELLEQLTRK